MIGINGFFDLLGRAVISSPLGTGHALGIPMFGRHLSPIAVVMACSLLAAGVC